MKKTLFLSLIWVSCIMGTALNFAAAPMMPDEQGNLTLTPAHITENAIYGFTIEIKEMPTLKTIIWAPGEDFSALQAVVLRDSPELNTITDSGSLPPSLRILMLKNLPKLHAVPSLTNLTFLKELCLWGTPLVPTISIPTTSEPISIMLLEVPLVTNLAFSPNQKVQNITLYKTAIQELVIPSTGFIFLASSESKNGMWVNITENPSLKRIQFVDDTIALMGEINDNPALEYLKVPQRSVTRSAELLQAFPQNPQKFSEIATANRITFTNLTLEQQLKQNGEDDDDSRSNTPEIEDYDE